MTGGTASQALAGVSRETIDMLEAYTDLVTKWTRKINLISRSTMEDAYQRHTLDSAQLYTLAPEKARSWVDLGSGGGFPGLVIAILVKGESRPLRLTLIESDQRKCVFLTTAIRTFGLDCDVLSERIERVPPLGADVISARALAPLDALLPLVAHHGHATTVNLFPKGRNHAEEIAQARKNWSFAFEDFPSITDPEAAILRIRGVPRGK